jgi:hypothetical protein
MEEMKNAYKVFVKKPERKRPFGIPSGRKEDNIKTYLKETGCLCVEWIHVARDRTQWWTLMNTVMKHGPNKRSVLLNQLSIYQLLKKNTTPWN